MEFDDYLDEYRKAGGTQKGLGIEIGISEQAMSRIVNKKHWVGLKMLNRMLNRMLAACGGEVSMEELCKEFRPDIYKIIMGERRHENNNK